MAIEALLTEPVVIEHVGPDRLTTDTLDTTGYMEPVAEVMPNVDEPWITAAETYRSTWRLFLTGGVVVKAADRAQLRGETFDIVEVHRAWNPRLGAEHHVEATVTRQAPPDYLMTVRRRDPSVDRMVAAPAPTVVATDVRVWMTPVTGAESDTGSQESVTFLFRADPVDIRHYDELVDQARTADNAYLVLWGVPVGTAAGRSHVQGECRYVLGAR